MVRDRSGDPSGGSGRVWRPSQMSKTGREGLQKVRDGSGNPPVVQDGSGDPPGGLGLVREPSRMSGTGREPLQKFWDGSEESP